MTQFKIFLMILAIVLVTLLVIGQSEFPFHRKVSSGDFSHVMRDNINKKMRVVDIAMLGAHDACSNLITKRSPLDPNSTTPYHKPWVKILAPGMATRLCVAQRSSVGALLIHGVRYLDVRITDFHGRWMAFHNCVSGALDSYLREIVDFLSTKDAGELIIFDIQWLEPPGNESFAALLSFIASVRVDGLSLLDFVRYDPLRRPLSELTFGDAVGDGSGVVILAKADMVAGSLHFNYGESIRSIWHDQIDTKELVERIEREVANVTSQAGIFRVNQAQRSPSFRRFWDGVLTLTGWSLLDMAWGYNRRIVQDPAFDRWLSVLPIFLADFADCEGFCELANEKICRFNKSFAIPES